MKTLLIIWALVLVAYVATIASVDSYINQAVQTPVAGLTTSVPLAGTSTNIQPAIGGLQTTITAEQLNRATSIR